MFETELTRQQVKQHFVDRGLSISDWARERGFKCELVYAVLNGRACGRRGQSYAIAVALGMKNPPKQALPNFLIPCSDPAPPMDVRQGNPVHSQIGGVHETTPLT